MFCYCSENRVIYIHIYPLSLVLVEADVPRFVCTKIFVLN